MKNRPSLEKPLDAFAATSKGITLVTTLLLLLLLVGMSLTMVLAVSSESLINGYLWPLPRLVLCRGFRRRGRAPAVDEI